MIELQRSPNAIFRAFSGSSLSRFTRTHTIGYQYVTCPFRTLFPLSSNDPNLLALTGPARAPVHCILNLGGSHSEPAWFFGRAAWMSVATATPRFRTWWWRCPARRLCRGMAHGAWPAREPAIRRPLRSTQPFRCRSSGRTRWPARIGGANQDYADTDHQ
jgi:hypothetical protein